MSYYNSKSKYIQNITLILITILLLQFNLSQTKLLAHYPFSQASVYSATEGDLPKPDFEGNTTFYRENYKGEADKAMYLSSISSYLKGDTSFINTFSTITMYYYITTINENECFFWIDYDYWNYSNQVRELQITSKTIAINRQVLFRGDILIPNYWNMIAVRHNNDFISIFRNGELITTISIDFNLSRTTPKVLQIAYGTGSYFPMSTKLSNLKIYDTALSDSEITALSFDNFQEIQGDEDLLVFYPLNSDLSNIQGLNQNLNFQSGGIKGYNSLDRNFRESSALMLPFYNTKLLMPTDFLQNNNEKLAISLWLRGRDREGAIASDERIKILSFLDNSNQNSILIQDDHVTVDSIVQNIDRILNSQWYHIVLQIDTVNLYFQLYINGIQFEKQTISNTNLLREANEIHLAVIPDIQHAKEDQGYLQLDDLRIYSRILNKPDVFQIKNIQYGSSFQHSSKLMAYYRLNGHEYSEVFITKDDDTQDPSIYYSYTPVYQDSIFLDSNNQQKVRYITDTQNVRFPILDNKQKIQITYSFWIKVEDPTQNFSVFEVNHNNLAGASNNINLSAKFVRIYTSSYSISTTGIFDTDWTHITMVLDPYDEKFHIFKNGKRIASKTFTAFSGPQFQLENPILGDSTCPGFMNCKYQISNIRVHKGFLPEQDIYSMYANDKTNIYSTNMYEQPTDGTQNLVAFFPLDGSLKDKLNPDTNQLLLENFEKGFYSTDRNLREQSCLMMPYYNTDLFMPTDFLQNHNDQLSFSFWIRGRERQGAIPSGELIKILSFTDNSNQNSIFIQDTKISVDSVELTIDSILKSKWNLITLLIDTVNLNYQLYINQAALPQQSITNSNLLREVSEIKLARIPVIQVRGDQGYLQLDDLRIYNSILTQNDIIRLIDIDSSTQSKLHPDLMAFYRLNGHKYSETFINDDDGTTTYSEQYEPEFKYQEFNNEQIQSWYLKYPTNSVLTKKLRFPKQKSIYPITYTFWMKAEKPQYSQKIFLNKVRQGGSEGYTQISQTTISHSSASQGMNGYRVLLEDEWTHIAIVYDLNPAQLINVYKNGKIYRIYGRRKLYNHMDFDAGIKSLEFGDRYCTQNFGTAANGCEQYVSNVKIYKSVLKDSEIQALYSQEKINYGLKKAKENTIDESQELLAYYPLNGNLQDKSRKNSNLLLDDDTKAYSCPDRERKETSALMLTRHNTDLTLPTNFLQNNNQKISFALWIRGRERQGATNPDELINILSFTDNSSQNSAFIQDTQVTVDSVDQTIDSILNSEWLHIVLQIDTVNLQFQIFINGFEQSPQSFSNTNLLSEVSSILLARIPDIQHSTSDQGFLSLDDLRIYNKILTKGEIYLIKNMKFSEGNPLEPSLMAFYRFNGHKYSDIYINSQDKTHIYTETDIDGEFIYSDFKENDASETHTIQTRYIQNPEISSEHQILRFPPLKINIKLTFQFWIKANNPSKDHEIFQIKYKKDSSTKIIQLFSKKAEIDNADKVFDGGAQIFDDNWAFVTMVAFPAARFIRVFKNDTLILQETYSNFEYFWQPQSIHLGDKKCPWATPVDECGFQIYNFKIFREAFDLDAIQNSYNYQKAHINTDTVLQSIEPCENKCTVCDSANNCIGDCLQDYYKDTSLGSCEACSPLCDGCQNSSTNCNQCKDNMMVPPLCTQCKDGYFYDSVKCQLCAPQCGTCSGTADNCGVQCDSQCSTCDTQGKCTNCSVGKLLTSNKECLDCHKKCFSCSQDKNNCLECSKGKFRSMDLQQNCGCLEGYIDNGDLDCVKGPVQNCQTYDEQGNCLQCKNQLLDPKDCKTIKILSQRFTFFETVSQSSNNTQNGQQQSQQQCLPAKNRQSQQPCNCLQGYHDQNKKQLNCEQCHYSCMECSDYQLCTKCNENQFRIFNEFKNTCDCMRGYKEDKKTQLCIKCYDYQGECVKQCPQNTIMDEKLFICKEKSFLTQSQTYMFWMSSIILAQCFIIFLVAIKIGKNIKKGQFLPTSIRNNIQDIEQQKFKKLLSRGQSSNSSNSGGSSSGGQGSHSDNGSIKQGNYIV